MERMRFVGRIKYTWIVGCNAVEEFCPVEDDGMDDINSNDYDEEEDVDVEVKVYVEPSLENQDNNDAILLYQC